MRIKFRSIVSRKNVKTKYRQESAEVVLHKANVLYTNIQK